MSSMNLSPPPLASLLLLYFLIVPIQDLKSLRKKLNLSHPPPPNYCPSSVDGNCPLRPPEATILSKLVWLSSTNFRTFKQRSLGAQTYAEANPAGSEKAQGLLSNPPSYEWPPSPTLPLEFHLSMAFGELGAAFPSWSRGLLTRYLLLLEILILS